MWPNLFESDIRIMPRKRACMFSSVVSSGKPGENFGELRLEGGEGVRDRNLQAFDAEISRERERVIDAAVRRVRARHGNADDVLRAQRLHGNRRDDRGIDAAAQAKHRRLEAAFRKIIAHPERKRREEIGRAFAVSEVERLRRLRVDHFFGRAKAGQLRDEFARSSSRRSSCHRTRAGRCRRRRCNNRSAGYARGRALKPSRAGSPACSG